MLLKLAKRNIWRNKRRTLITAASILFAVLFSILMESIQEGAWDHMMNNVVNFYYGYGQIQPKGYQNDQSIEKAFKFSEVNEKIDNEIPHLRTLVPRLESFALASYENNTKGALIVGVDPDKERQFTGIDKRVVRGEYWKTENNAALVGHDLADYLNADDGDTIVLISQGYHGVNSVGKFVVQGIVNMGSPALNSQMIYLPLEAAQIFFGADSLVTSIALDVDDKKNIDAVLEQLGSTLDINQFDLLDWKGLIPSLVQAKEFDNLATYVIYFILYSIIAFGIFGTILMMTKERSYEFGVLTAIGMQKWKLALNIWLETLLLALIGAFCGIIAAIPVVLYFHHNPIKFYGRYAETFKKFDFEAIVPAAFEVKIFAVQALVVVFITAVLAIYPIIKIKNLKPIRAMRG